MPIILCTGYSELVDETNAHTTGIDEFLLKPFHKTEINDKIRRALERKKLPVGSV